MNHLRLLAVACLAVPALSAQMPDGSAHRAALDKLGFMVGRWEGEAWMQRGPEKVQTRMVEIVERKLDGTVLLVEGRGVVPATGGSAERVVHHALAVLSFEPQAGGYTLRSHIATGQYGDFAVLPIEGGVQWSREVPGGKIRNTALISATEWNEKGEFSRDGVTWMTIMEISLKKQ